MVIGYFIGRALCSQSLIGHRFLAMLNVGRLRMVLDDLSPDLL